MFLKVCSFSIGFKSNYCYLGKGIIKLFLYMQIADYLQISSKNEILKAVQCALNSAAEFEHLLQLAMGSEGKTSWRASWAINHFPPDSRNLFDNYIPLIIQVLPTISHVGQKGLLLRFLSRQKLDFTIEGTGVLIDECFKQMVNPLLPAFVKYYSLDIMVSAYQQLPELKTEFIASLEMLIPYANTKSLAHKGKQIRRHLESNRPFAAGYLKMKDKYQPDDFWEEGE